MATNAALADFGSAAKPVPNAFFTPDLGAMPYGDRSGSQGEVFGSLSIRMLIDNIIQAAIQHVDDPALREAVRNEVVNHPEIQHALRSDKLTSTQVANIRNVATSAARAAAEKAIEAEHASSEVMGHAISAIFKSGTVVTGAYLGRNISFTIPSGRQLTELQLDRVRRAIYYAKNGLQMPDDNDGVWAEFDRELNRFKIHMRDGIMELYDVTVSEVVNIVNAVGEVVGQMVQKVTRTVFDMGDGVQFAKVTKVEVAPASGIERVVADLFGPNGGRDRITSQTFPVAAASLAVPLIPAVDDLGRGVRDRGPELLMA